MVKKDFYIVPEEIYRIGNSESPRLSAVRASEVDVITIDGITTIIANDRGVSLYTKEELERTELTGWVWRFAANTTIPVGLKLVNDKPGHYMLAPARNMPVDKYKELVEQMAPFGQKVWKKRA